MKISKEENESIDERLRKVATQMRKHSEAVNGRIAADLIERELNKSHVINIADYTSEELRNLITLHEGKKWSISFKNGKVPAHETELRRADTIEDNQN